MLLLVALCSLPLWLLRPHQHTVPAPTAILPAAAPALPETTADYRVQVCDLNESTLLAITTDRFDPAEGIPWQGHADLIDRRTGRRSRLKGLTQLLNRLESLCIPDEFNPSPKGTWLMWRNPVALDMSTVPVVAGPDGTHYREVGEARSSVTCWLDDRHTAEEVNYEKGKDPSKVVIHDVADPKADRDIDAHSAQGKAIIKQIEASE
jgi:hypothetical protein